MTDGTRMLRGVMLAGLDCAKLVPLDGGRSIRVISVNDDGARDMKLEGVSDYVSFVDRIQRTPRDTVSGYFMLTPGKGGAVVIGAAARTATDEELQEAIRIDLDQAMAGLSAKLIRRRLRRRRLQ
jgi:hypothetical protein